MPDWFFVDAHPMRELVECPQCFPECLDRVTQIAPRKTRLARGARQLQTVTEVLQPFVDAHPLLCLRGFLTCHRGKDSDREEDGARGAVQRQHELIAIAG